MYIHVHEAQLVHVVLAYSNQFVYLLCIVVMTEIHSKYVTIYRKKALVAQITQIELLVPLECAF